MHILSAEVWLPLGVYDQVANDFGTKAKLSWRSQGNPAAYHGSAETGITAASARPALGGLAANLEKAFPVEQKDQTFISAPVSRFTTSYSPSGDGGIQKSRHSSWDVGGGFPRRVPQPREHAARARHRAAQRNCDPSRPRWKPRAHRPPAFNRRLGARASRWRRRTVLGLWSSDLLIASMRS